MKTISIRIAFLSGVLSLPICLATGSADTLPARKAGLWEVSVSQVGSPGPAHVMKQCIDEQTDAKMQQNGTEMVERMGGKCVKNDLKKTATGYEGSADCTVSGSHIVSKSTFSGDFQSKYTGEITTSYDPPMMGNAQSTTNLAAKYLGPCEADQVPGDMILPNGMKVNANQIIGHGAPPALSKQGAAGQQPDIEKMKAEAIQRMLQRQQQSQAEAAPK